MRNEQVLADIPLTTEGQWQHGAAFVELGSQLAQLDRLLSELDLTGHSHMYHRPPVRQGEQMTGAQQPALAEQLSMAQQACSALQQQLGTAQEDAKKTAEYLAAARQNESQLQAQVLSHQQHVSQLEGSLSTAQQNAAAVAHQETACLQEQLDTVQQQVSSLHQQVTASQQQVADLQAQLSTEQSRVAALEQALAELRTILKDRSTALESAQEHIKQLQQAQQQPEEACAAAATQHKQLSKQHESSEVAQHELQKQLTEMSERLGEAQEQLEEQQQLVWDEMRRVDALERGCKVLIAPLSTGRLVGYMDSSQPAVLRKAAASELANRLSELENRLKVSDSQPEAREEELKAWAAEIVGFGKLLSRLQDDNDEEGYHDDVIAKLTADAHVAILRVVKIIGDLAKVSGHASSIASQLLGQPGVVDTLVQLLHEGSGDVQAAVVEAIWAFAPRTYAGTSPYPEAFAPTLSEPNRWPVIEGFAAMLQSPAVWTHTKGRIALALPSLVLPVMKGISNAGAVQLHPAVEAAVKCLVALLENEYISHTAASSIRELAESSPGIQSLVGGLDGAISRLWCLATDPEKSNNAWLHYYSDAPAAVIRGHGLNQSRLMHQDGFMEDLLGLLPKWQSTGYGRFLVIVEELVDNPEFVLRLSRTAVAPLLVAGLKSDNWHHDSNTTFLRLLLSMSEARPGTVYPISLHSDARKVLQVLSEAKEKDGTQRYPDANSLLQLLRQQALW
jgi:hypothetical protein